ncbi:hypothetical protein A9Q88_07435 [Gammaproteobacteria bacterium 50_400_T64]|nr:hypothetical protein A9Q88_07435 [Gammaproteobacteria bacterium 50_400_T64]
MAGFIPPHRQQQFLKACADFFNSWLAELALLLPVSWRNALSGKQALCRLTLDAGHLKLAVEAQGRETAMGRIVSSQVPACSVRPLSQDDISALEMSIEDQALSAEQLMANIATLGSDAHGRVVLELSDDYLLIRDISLPLVSDSDIDSVLAHEIDRLSPFAKNNVCYSYEVLQKDQQAGKLKLRLVCLEKTELEILLEQCESLGLNVAQVQQRTDKTCDKAFSVASNLLPLDKRPLKEKVWNGTNQIAVALVIALLMTVLILPVWLYEKQIDALNKEVNALLDKSKVVRAKQARLVIRLDIHDALVTRKNTELEKLIILHNLTQVIPDNTWLTRVTIRGESVEIEGESDKSSDLIEKLESQEAFHQVEFASSVTRNSRTAKERFQIKMQLSNKAARLDDENSSAARVDREAQVARGRANE